MYAVIKTGGKQQKVAAGDTIHVELLEGGPGDKVTFEPILVVDDAGKTHFGKDVLGATVTGTLVGDKKGEKIRVFKYKPKSGYKRTRGHRQQYTEIEIGQIGLGKKKAAPKAAPKKETVGRGADAE